jgi:hypothetical protein
MPVTMPGWHGPVTFTSNERLCACAARHDLGDRAAALLAERVERDVDLLADGQAAGELFADHGDQLQARRVVERADRLARLHDVADLHELVDDDAADRRRIVAKPSACRRR